MIWKWELAPFAPFVSGMSAQTPTLAMASRAIVQRPPLAPPKQGGHPHPTPGRPQNGFILLLWFALPGADREWQWGLRGRDLQKESGQEKVKRQNCQKAAAPSSVQQHSCRGWAGKTPRWGVVGEGRQRWCCGAEGSHTAAPLGHLWSDVGLEMKQGQVTRPPSPAEVWFMPWCMCGSWRGGQGVRESSAPGWAMALPMWEGDALGPWEESLEVHPAGEEFLPAVAVPLMNRPTDGAAGLQLCSSPCRCAPPPTATATGTEWPPQRNRGDSMGRAQGLLAASFTLAHLGGRGAAVDMWIPCEIPAKSAHSLLYLLLKGAWQASKGFLGGYFLGDLKRNIKFYSDRPGP